MKTVLLPVKDFNDAKQRLAGALGPSQRAALARAMLSDVLAAISQARLPQRVIVFTASAEVVETVRPFPVEIVEELTVQGHSAAVNRMVEQLAATDSHILSIAGDLPTMTAEDIDRVFDSDIEAPTEVRLVASRDGTGTNAALFVLPARIQMAYGEGSLRRHLANAASAGLKAEVLRIPGIEFDIDTPEDLEFFLRKPRMDSDTWRFIQSYCVGGLVAAGFSPHYFEL